MLDIAFRSDWKFSAVLAGVVLFGGVALLPALAGSNPLFLPLAALLAQLAWLLAAVFGGVALVRYFVQRRGERSGAAAPFPPTVPLPGRGGDTAPALTGLDRAWTLPQPVPPRPTGWSLDVIDRVEWKRFEELCCAFYREKGIRAETTRLGPDGGIDIRLFQDEADPARVAAVVQCKAWARPVGVGTVRELRGVMAHEKVDKGFFMAPNGFTPDARMFAADNRITLLDGKLILALLQRLPAEASQRLLALATEGDWTTPTCPDCGAKMAVREGRRGAFWGCSGYPKCRRTLRMRRRAAAPAA